MKPKIREWKKVSEHKCKCLQDCEFKAIFYAYGDELVKIEIVNPFLHRSESIVLYVSELKKILKKIKTEVE